MKFRPFLTGGEGNRKMATTDFVVKNGLVVNEDARILDTTTSISTTTGALVVDGGLGIAGAMNVGGAVGLGNNLTVTGDLAVNGGDITTNQATFNLINTTSTTVNIAGAATDIQIGSATGTTNVNNNLDVDGDVNIDGGDLTVSTTTFNLANTNATTLNIGGAATDIQIGATTGTTNVNNNLDVDGDVNIDGGDLTVSTATFNLANANATTVNFAGAATAIDIGAATGTTSINNNLDVDGDVNVDGGDITTNQASFNLLNTTATTVNAFGAATAIDIGAATGTTSINNNLDIDLDLNVDGGDITTNSTSFNLINTTAATVNFANAATALSVGANTGTLTLRHPTVVGVNATQNLYNTVATTVNFAGAATDIQIGSATGTTNVNNNLDVDGDVNIDGGDLTVSTAIFNLANTTATTVNFAGTATDIQIGATTGTTNVNNNLDVDGDVNVDGGNITTNQASFNLININATTLNIGGAATAIDIGASTGTTSINNNLDVDGDVNVDGGDITTNSTSFNLINTTATTVNFAGAATALSIGSSSGTTTVNHNLTVTGDLTVNGTTTTINATTVTVDDKNLELGSVASPSDTTADGGGITLKGSTDKTILWVDSTDRWTFNQGVEAVSIQNTPIGSSIASTGAFTSLTANEAVTFTQGTASSSTGTGTLVVTGGVGVSGNIYAGGNGVFAGDVTVSGGDIVTAAATASNLYATTTTGNIGIATGQTSGTLTVGGTAQTGTITIDRSASAHTLNIGTGANAAAVTKTINFGTGGAASSITNINVGSANGGTTTLSSPTVNATGNFIVSSTNAEATYFAVQRSTAATEEARHFISDTSYTIKYTNDEAASSIILNFVNTDTETGGGAAASDHNVTFSATQTGVSLSMPGTSNVSATTLTSTVAAGTAPFTVASTTVVTNLNADTVDGIQGASLLRSNATDNYTSGILTFDSGTTLTAADGATVNFNNANGTAPFTVASSTVVTNLNADAVDGKSFGTFSAAGGILYATSTSAASGTAAGTAGQVLTSGGAGAPTWTTATDANTASAIVQRDASGNFSAGTITATLSGNASTATRVLSSDTRNDATTPETLAAPGTIFDFKANTSNGLADGGTYHGLMTYRPYGSATDWTGGPSHQIGFTSNGNLYHRSGSNTTWGSWNKIYESDDAATANTASTLVLRDASGNFSAGTITATLNGDAASVDGKSFGTFSAAGGILYATSTTAGAGTAAGTAGQVLTSGGAGAPTWTTATDANTASAIVQRDASGNFSAGTITANLTGTASSATNADTVDSLHASSFIRSDAADTFTGALTAQAEILIDQNGNSGNIRYETASGVYIPRPIGGQYVTTTATVTGALQITLPASAYGSNDMISFWVDVYDYATDESISIEIWGYVQATGNWNNMGARIHTNRTDKDFTIRYGVNTAATNHIVWIGELGTTWSYPQVNVRDFQAGYTAPLSNWTGDWSVDFQPAVFATVTDTTTGHLPAAETANSATTAGSTTTVTTGGSVTTTVLTSGSTGTAGSVEGTWTLTAGSSWQATFSDLAEWYDSDQDYEPGTVLVFGGEFEVTMSTTANDTRVAGGVTTNPAFIMNVDRPGPSACLALQGKIPLKVIGQVQKGDLLVTSDVPGHAMVNNSAAPYTVIGKALENKTTEEQGVIQVSIGR